MEYLLQVVVGLTVLAVGGLWALVTYQGREITNLRLHVAEHYITGPEIDKVEQAVAELTKAVSKLSDMVISIKADLEAAAKFSAK